MWRLARVYGPFCIEVGEAGLDELFEDRQVDVGEFVEVEAGFAEFVLAEAGEDGAVVLIAGHDVEHEVGFARAEAGGEEVAFAAAVVAVVVLAKADDRGAPHDRWVAGGTLKKVEQDKGVGLAACGRDGLQEVKWGHIGGGGFVAAHGGLFLFVAIAAVHFAVKVGAKRCG